MGFKDAGICIYGLGGPYRWWVIAFLGGCLSRGEAHLVLYAASQAGSELLLIVDLIY